jgi:NAD(P)-dependent dehydrogenase (short-subunit alcohol dehydrogenase family)
MENAAQTLQGQVAVVTGGGRGIGAGISRKLAALGATVVLCGRTRAPLDTTAAAIRQAGGRCDAIECDLTRLESVEALAKHVDSGFGRLDILVNNAGVGGGRVPLHELSPQVWEDVMNTNLRGVFYAIRSLAPLMLRSGGHIINISSLAGKNPLPRGAAYSASKWGLNGLSYGVAEELREQNIRVSVICPGSVDTSFSPRRGGKDTRKMLKPDDVAQAVAMLVTQEPQSFISEILLRPTQKP